jgi:CubicO group peptidase (beta-lactamase class C family)
VLHHGEVVYSDEVGFLDPETKIRPVRPDSLFDLASVTKLWVTTSFMRLVEAGKVALDQPVSSVLPQFSGLRPVTAYEDPLQPGVWVAPKDAAPVMVDASAVTYRHLLTHSSGLPAWRPLKDQPDSASARQMALNTNFFYPTGQRVIYSDIGLILLGLSIEQLSGLPLDEAVRQMVTAPLGLSATRYLPVGGQPYDTSNIVPTELCAWRNRRVVGEVHDENASRLGGVAGHAGLFSTAAELAAFGNMYLQGGAPLLQTATVAEMTRLQASEGTTRRGLGFALWCDDPEASGNPFSPQAYGHTGFTGTSLWMDPQRQMVTALLTNRVYYGRNASSILAFRVKLHRAIVEAVDA